MRVPAELLIECSRGSNRRAACDLVLNWSALLAAVVLAHLLHHWAAYLLAIVLIGGFQNRLIVLSHECWHRKAFRPVWLNQLAGACAYSYPVATPYFSDQRRHMGHHRFVGSPDDPDWIDYEREEFHSGPELTKFLVGQVVGAKIVWRVLDILKGGRGQTADRAANRRVKPSPSDLAGIAVFQVLVFSAFVAGGRWWEYVVLWLIPLVTIASFLVTFRALLEHIHPQRDVAPQERLYDFTPGPVQRWFLSPHLFHLHALHHTYAGVPYYRLPELKRAIVDGGYALPGRVQPDYVSTLRDYLRKLDAVPLQTAT